MREGVVLVYLLHIHFPDTLLFIIIVLYTFNFINFYSFHVLHYYYIFYCHAFYTCASGWGTWGNPTLRFDTNKLIECIVYCIAL